MLRIDWMERAACQEADPDLFFPPGWEEGNRVLVADAKSICARCAVRPACLDWAVTTGQAEGVWGGSTPKERRRLRSV
jgi:WhiB family redox-sensing transcriptional regulator